MLLQVLGTAGNMFSSCERHDRGMCSSGEQRYRTRTEDFFLFRCLNCARGLSSCAAAASRSFLRRRFHRGFHGRFLSSNSTFFPSGREWETVPCGGLRTKVSNAGVLGEIVLFGSFQMNHLGPITLKTAKEKRKLVAFKELEFKEKKCFGKFIEAFPHPIT